MAMVCPTNFLKTTLTPALNPTTSWRTKTTTTMVCLTKMKPSSALTQSIQTPTVMDSVMEMEPAMARAIQVLIPHRLTHCSQSTPMVMPTLTTILMAKAD